MDNLYSRYYFLTFKFVVEQVRRPLVDCPFVLVKLEGK